MRTGVASYGAVGPGQVGMPVLAVVLVLALSPALAGCGDGEGAGEGGAVAPQASPAAAERPGEADLMLGFEQVVVPGDVVPGTVSQGTADVSVSVVTANGGALLWADAADGGVAVSTPAFAPEGTIPAAALVVRPVGGDPDPLDPGTADFALGADFRADPAQRGRAGDDGDNLLQRGRFGEPAQYKIQLDHGVPSCRIAGTGGEVVVEADGPVVPDRWYRTTCRRAGGAVRLRLLDLEDASAKPREWVVKTDPGDVSLAGIPLSVGAKVSDDGRLDPAGFDQFHGTIDRVYVDVS